MIVLIKNDSIFASSNNNERPQSNKKTLSCQNISNT